MGGAIRCRSTNESLGLASLVKKILDGFLLFISISLFVLTVFGRESQSQKGLLSFLHGITWQFKPLELDNVVSTMVVPMTLMWVKRCFCENLFSVGDACRKVCFGQPLQNMPKNIEKIDFVNSFMFRNQFYSRRLWIFFINETLRWTCSMFIKVCFYSRIKQFCGSTLFVWPDFSY